MKVKHQLARLDKQSVLSQEHQLLKNMQQMESLEKERQRQFNLKYASEAREDLQLRQRKKEWETRREREEKEYYRNRYSVGDMTQSYLTRSNSYENPIRTVKLSFMLSTPNKSKKPSTQTPNTLPTVPSR